MERRPPGVFAVAMILVSVVLILAASPWRSGNGTAAQDRPTVPVGEAIDVLETRQAEEELQATLAAQATELADLETRVARLETAAAGPTLAGSPIAATPVAGGASYEATDTAAFAAWTDKYLGAFVDPWVVRDGILAFEGDFGYSIIFAPHEPAGPDYVIEAEVQVTDSAVCEGLILCKFGLMARYVEDTAGTEDAGYEGGVYVGAVTSSALIETYATLDTLASLDLGAAGLPDPTTGWHTYRFEVEGDHLRLLIDGVPVAEATDSRYAEAGQVGIFSNIPIEVRAVRVFAS
jgi:hypothetical protein